MLVNGLFRQFLLPEQAEQSVLSNTTVASKIRRLIFFSGLGYLKDAS